MEKNLISKLENLEVVLPNPIHLGLDSPVPFPYSNFLDSIKSVGAI